MPKQNSLCFPCLEKVRTKFPVFPVPWPPCINKASGRWGIFRRKAPREFTTYFLREDARFQLEISNFVNKAVRHDNHPRSYIILIHENCLPYPPVPRLMSNHVDSEKQNYFLIKQMKTKYIFQKIIPRVIQNPQNEAILSLSKLWLLLSPPPPQYNSLNVIGPCVSFYYKFLVV